MSDESEALQIVRLQLANSIPRSVKIILASVVAFFVCMNMAGINLAGPLQIMAVAYAEAYKANLQQQNESLNQIQQRLEYLETLAHEPGKSQ